MFQDDVSVGAAHPEPRHPHPPRTPRLRPLAFLGQQFHRARRPVHLRAGRVNMQRARQHPVPHRHDHLDDAGHPGGGLRMPDVRLQRAQPQRPFTTLPVRRQQGLRLDRVAQCRARAVCLHRVHVTRRQPGRRQCAPNHPLLGGAVGGGEAVGGAVLVDGAATYDRQDPVSQPFRVRQALHQQHAHALRPARAVRRRGEGLAAAVRGQAPLAGELHERLGAGHHRHPAGERHRALPGPQCLDGQVEGDQRGRARRVHGHRGALEAEHVGHAARGHAGRRPGHEVAFEVAGGAGTVVLVHHAGEDADVLAPQGGRVDAGPFERLPGRLQEQSLLRVHGQGLARGDAEEGRVEAARVTQEAALADVAGAGVVGVRVEEAVQVPAPVGGEGAGPLAARPDQLPQVLRGGDTARQAAGHAHDDDGVVGRVGEWGGSGRGGGERGGAAGQFTAQQAGQGPRGGMVEGGGGGEAEPGGLGEAVAQFDHGDRGQAQVGEGAFRMDGLSAGQAEQVGELVADQVGEEPVAVGVRELGEALAQGVRDGSVRGGGPGRPVDQVVQER
ncbi:putative protein OS=Streptomyces fumanus OX=67302 GN=GCM10018772_62440 PE=4 SV=1 [Streptomyces fumanus]